MREVVVTGIGMLSCAGEGVAAHRRALEPAASPAIDTERFAPYAVHAAPPLDWDRQIPKKADQRQMEPWQRLGVYAAGLALDDAGLKDDAAVKARMELVVAAGGGERDVETDERILTGLRTAPDAAGFLNERLSRDLRPTLFLAQLSNLLAGNIAVVHGVTGASRTFMGEETSAVEALRVARQRIAFGQADLVLVGGSYNAERPDVLLIYEMGGFLWKRPYRSVWDRPRDGGGFILGSAAGFAVLEAREHAEARGARRAATFAGAATTRTRRASGDVAASLTSLWTQVQAPPRPGMIVSGATGVARVTEEEAATLARLAPDIRPIATGDAVGHTMEAHPVMGFAVAAAALAAGDAADAVVTSIGHHRGEGVLRLTAVQ